MFGNSIEGRGAFVVGSLFFGALDFLPVRPDFIDVFNFGFAEDVWMAANQFVGDVAGNFFKIECAAFLAAVAGSCGKTARAGIGPR